MNTQTLDFNEAQVLIIGDVMLDRYWHGATSRISPEAPIPVVHIKEMEERPGGAGNVALNVAALGARAILFGLCGEDDAGQLLQQGLQQSHIQAKLLTLKNVPTVTKLRVLSLHQQLIRLDFEDNERHAQAAKELQLQALNDLNHCNAVIISDYGKGALYDIPALIAAARQRHLPVLVDPKSIDFSLYRGASVITPNFKEFQSVVGPCKNDHEIQEKGATLLKQHDIQAILVTRGERGMTLLQQDQAPHHLPTQAREVFDVTGAGDTVIAAMATALAADYPIKDAMNLANVAAGIVVGKLGAATASVTEMRHVLKAALSSEGIMDESQLMLALKEARSRGEKIVMTNGCFDILHPGHIAYLEEAKALGDRLVVAVNDDSSVQRLNKGPERPINPLESRMAVLASLKAVDWVVPFAEDTPERLVSQCLPDVLVKGGDWRQEQIAGSRAVLDNGGAVKSLAFHPGFSTTAIINKIAADVALAD